MKPPIIILHGWGSRIEKWQPLKKELEKAGFEVFLPYLPGFGQAKPPKKPWSVSDYVNWLKNYLKEKSLKNYFLIGHSFGGRLAIKLASQKPTGLKGLILINSAGIKPRNYFKRLIFFILAKVGKIIFLLPPFCFLAYSARKTLYQLAREKDYFKTRGVMRATFKKVISEDLKGYLRKIKTPTLILWGKKDSSTPLQDGELMARFIPGSRLFVFPKAGHSLPWQLAKEVAQKIVQFTERIK